MNALFKDSFLKRENISIKNVKKTRLWKLRNLNYYYTKQKKKRVKQNLRKLIKDIFLDLIYMKSKGKRGKASKNEVVPREEEA